jgi:thiol-disulfide isomerase/thioredoxin
VGSVTARGTGTNVGGSHERRRRSRVVPAALALALTLVVALAGCSGRQDNVDQAGDGFGFVQQSATQDFVPLAKRKAAPDLTGPTLTSGRLDLDHFTGRITVVNFWASWCSPCRAETPGLVSLASTDTDVAFVGINEKDSVSAAKAFARDYKVTYPSIVDKIGTLAARWPVPPGLPSTFVLDRQGRLAARFTGGVLPSDLTGVLTKLRAET